MSQETRSVIIGNWLFRWRSYLPLALTAVIVPALLKFSYPDGIHAYDLAWEMVCFAISLLGLALRCYAIGHAPKGTSGRNTKCQIAETLNTTGIYSITRNPLYLGNFFMMLGVMMFVRFWWAPLIYTLAFRLYYERIIMAEESFLKQRFGGEYKSYLASVPAFIPNPRLWRSSAVSFSFKTVLKREYSGLFGIISAFTILEIAGDYVVDHVLTIDPVWEAIFIFGLVVYLVLRTLKKKTKLLDVEGR